MSYENLLFVAFVFFVCVLFIFLCSFVFMYFASSVVFRLDVCSVP